jgi:hypothetical protein
MDRRLGQFETVFSHAFELVHDVFAAQKHRRQIAGESPERRGGAAGILQFSHGAEVVLDPGADHRFGRRPHIEFRVERARHAFDDDHGLLQKHKLNPCLHVEEAGDLEQEGQEFRHGNLIGGAGMDRLADRPDRLREILDLVHARHITSLEMDLRHAPVIALDEAMEDFREKAPLFETEAAHDAEVHHCEAPLRVDKQISLMHVGVEKSVPHRRAKKRLNDVAAEGLQIIAL